MSDPGYPAARAAAPRIREHFALHLGSAGAFLAPGPRQPVPDLEDIEAVVDAAFWASLRREEGFAPKISLALTPPEDTKRPLLFSRQLALDPAVLTKVAPAVERPGIHLGVWRQDGHLKVWGTTREIPAFCFVLEVAAPGLLVVKHHRGDGGKFVNVAVLEGDRVKVIDEHASKMVDCPELLTSLLGFDAPGAHLGSVNLLVELAVSMRAHRRGGIMLIVPSGTEMWRESVVHPIPYAVEPPFVLLAELVRRGETEHGEREWQEEVEDAVQAVAGLSAVDGATVLTDTCELLAFGAKIARRRGSTQVEHASITEPIEGGEASIVSSSGLGGTRHMSAAQFVHDQRNALALVASQDGRFTIFAWSPCDNRVHAHRVETLLM